MPGHVKVGGSWKSVATPSVKVGGSWKAVDAGYTKVAGAWKQWYTAFVAQPAYELIDSRVLNADTPFVTFSSIPQDYKHLQLRVVPKTDNATTANLQVRFNGNTTASYTRQYLRGNGSTVTSLAETGATLISLNFGANSTANIFSSGIIDILDYTSSSKNTSVRTLEGVMDTTNSYIRTESGLWVNTSPVTQINLTLSAGNFTTNSRFSLYGIKG